MKKNTRTPESAYENAMARWEYLQRIVATIYTVSRGLTRDGYHKRNEAVEKACGMLLDEAYRQAFKCQELMFAMGLGSPELRERAKALAYKIYSKDNAEMSWMFSPDLTPLHSYSKHEEDHWKAVLAEMFGPEKTEDCHE
jgi:hypothetical protein